MRQQKKRYITLIHSYNGETKLLKPPFFSSKFKKPLGSLISGLLESLPSVRKKREKDWDIQEQFCHEGT